MAQGSSRILIIGSIIVATIVILALVFPWGFLKIGKWIALLFLGLLFWFFRDPERQVPEEKNVVVSPADGKIVSIEKQDQTQKIAIFMSLFNVHVNRIPLAGKITAKKYTPGQYLPAFDPNCYLKNEQSEILIKQGDTQVKVTQIAGLIARKIVNKAEPGMDFKTGERFGLIKFGSRVDVTIPKDWKIQGYKGQRVKAGESILATIS